MKEPVTQFDLFMVMCLSVLIATVITILITPKTEDTQRQNEALTYLSNRVEVINQMEQAVKHFNKK